MQLYNALGPYSICTYRAIQVWFPFVLTKFVSCEASVYPGHQHGRRQHHYILFCTCNSTALLRAQTASYPSSLRFWRIIPKRAESNFSKQLVTSGDRVRSYLLRDFLLFLVNLNHLGSFYPKFLLSSILINLSGPSHNSKRGLSLPNSQLMTASRSRKSVSSNL